MKAYSFSRFLMPLSLLLFGACASKGSPKITALESQVLALQNQQRVQAAKLEDLSESFLILSSSYEKLASQISPSTSLASPTQSLATSPLDQAENGVPDTSSFLGVGLVQPPLPGKPQFTNSHLGNVKSKPNSMKLAKEENNLKAPVVTTASTATNASKDYQDAYQFFQKNDLNAAEAKFSEFLRKYPAHEYSDNAQYWLGEIYLRQAHFGQAALAFEKVVKLYPEGNKVPEALLKAGESYEKSSQFSDAKRVLARLITDYPSSLAAEEARGQLNKKMKE